MKEGEINKAKEMAKILLQSGVGYKYYITIIRPNHRGNTRTKQE